MTEADELLSVSKAAALLGVTAETLREWDNAGKRIRSTRTVGGHRRFRLGDVLALRNGTVK
jgi:putative resolvase